MFQVCLQVPRDECSLMGTSIRVHQCRRPCSTNEPAQNADLILDTSRSSELILRTIRKHRAVQHKVKFRCRQNKIWMSKFAPSWYWDVPNTCRNLQDVVAKLVKHGPHSIASASGRKIRTVINGIIAVDTVHADYVWEHPYYPQFYVPFKELHHDLIVNRELVAGIRDPESGNFGAEIWSYPKTSDSREKKCTYVHFLRGKLKDYVRFTFKEMGWSVESFQSANLTFSRFMVRRRRANIRPSQRSNKANLNPPIFSSSRDQHRRSHRSKANYSSPSHRAVATSPLLHPTVICRSKDARTKWSDYSMPL